MSLGVSLTASSQDIDVHLFAHRVSAKVIEFPSSRLLLTESFQSNSDANQLFVGLRTSERYEGRFDQVISGRHNAKVSPEVLKCWVDSVHNYRNVWLGDTFLMDKEKTPKLDICGELYEDVRPDWVLGKRRTDEYRKFVDDALETAVSDSDFDLLLRFYAQKMERVYDDPPLYLGKPTSHWMNTETEEAQKRVKWFRARLGVPRKVGNKWHKLPIPTEVPDHRKYQFWVKRQRENNLDTSADAWLSDSESGFGIYFTKFTQSKFATLFRDQIRLINESGLKALLNQMSSGGKSADDFSEKLIPLASVRAEIEIECKNTLQPLWETHKMHRASKERKKQK